MTPRATRLSIAAGDLRNHIPTHVSDARLFTPFVGRPQVMRHVELCARFRSQDKELQAHEATLRAAQAADRLALAGTIAAGDVDPGPVNELEHQAAATAMRRALVGLRDVLLVSHREAVAAVLRDSDADLAACAVQEAEARTSLADGLAAVREAIDQIDEVTWRRDSLRAFLDEGTQLKGLPSQRKPSVIFEYPHGRGVLAVDLLARLSEYHVDDEPLGPDPDLAA